MGRALSKFTRDLLRLCRVRTEAGARTPQTLQRSSAGAYWLGPMGRGPRALRNLFTMLFTRFALASGGQPLQRRPVVVVDFDFEVAEPADRRRRGVEKRALRACPLRIRLRAIIRDISRLSGLCSRDL